MFFGCYSSFFRSVLLVPLLNAFLGISSSFIRTLLSLVVVSAAYPRIATPAELVEFPLSLAAFWIFIGGNVLLQIVRIYYNRIVLASFWSKENSSSLKTQLLVLGQQSPSTIIAAHPLTQLPQSPMCPMMPLWCPFQNSPTRRVSQLVIVRDWSTPIWSNVSELNVPLRCTPCCIANKFVLLRPWRAKRVTLPLVLR